MKYRDMIGFSKKKQKFVKKAITPAPPKPSITKKLKEEFGDTIKEGPAYDYAKQWDNIKKTYGAFWDAVHDLESLLQSKGMSREAKKVNQMYKKNVEGFFKFLYKIMSKLL